MSVAHMNRPPVTLSSQHFPILRNAAWIPARVKQTDGLDLPAMVCRPVFQEMSIHANGDIVCSCADPTGLRVYGNVYRDRIEDVFQGQMYEAMRQWQMNSKADCWCPVIESACAGRVVRAVDGQEHAPRKVKMLQLEPVSYCNLRCPSCPVTTHFPLAENVGRGNQLLPLEVMLDVIDQLPDLETLLFYNFGEAFLHPHAVAFLREVKRKRPDIFIANSTNALVFGQDTLLSIAREKLVNRLVFAIDGATPETYSKYRINGNFKKAMGNLTAFVRGCEEHGTRSDIEIVWQYILFEWNDSNEELARAKRAAQALGVPINWIVTHTPGASQLYLPDSEALRSLQGGGTFSSDTCEVQLQDFQANDLIAKGRYLARITGGNGTIHGAAGSESVISVTVENVSNRTWTAQGDNGFHVGVILRNGKGKRIDELPGTRLPDAAGYPRRAHTVDLRVQLPREAGSYELLIDLVEADRCWFHEHGSPPLLIPLAVNPS